MKGWTLQPVGDLVTLKSGGTPSKANPEYWGGTIPWVSAKDMHGIRYFDTEDHITQRAVDEGAKLAAPGDLLLLVRGMRLAKELAIGEAIRHMSFNQDVKLIVCNAELYPRFLLYWALTNSTTILATADEAAHGTKRLQTPQLLALEILLPPLSTQRRIADILSAYDDLIANNNRRIALLEESIHLLYDEWFVKLRFPGHEVARVVDGVPEGWESVMVNDLTEDITRGVSPKYVDEGMQYVVNQKCVRDRRIDLEPARTHDSKVPPQKRLREWDILVNSTGTGTLGRVAQVNFVPEGLTVDTHVTIVRGLEGVDPIWLGVSLERLQSTIESLGQGSTNQTELRREDLGRLTVLTPSVHLRDAFGRNQMPSRLMIRRLLESNTRLREARDRLLPELMSGRLSV